MYTIGAFSKLSHVSARMLRHYDAIGLLRPPMDGHRYRYYDEDQLSTLIQIGDPEELRLLPVPGGPASAPGTAGPLPADSAAAGLGGPQGLEGAAEKPAPDGGGHPPVWREPVC